MDGWKNYFPCGKVTFQGLFYVSLQGLLYIIYCTRKGLPGDGTGRKKFEKSRPLVLHLIHPRKLTCPLKRDYFNRKCIFQPLILRGHVGIPGEYWFSSSKAALLIVFGGFWLGGSRCFQEIAKKIGSGKGKSKLGIS